MSRNRKLLHMQKGNLTQEQQFQKAEEEEALKVGKEQLNALPSWLVNAEAEAEYKRLMIEFEKLDIIGNLDLNNLVGYCNACAYYWETVEQLTPKKLIIKEANSTGGKKTVRNPLIEIQKVYAEEMRKFGAKLGLDVDSRLKLASMVVQQKKDELEDEFGDI